MNFDADGNAGRLAPRLCAETFGTFCLVFAGTGAVVINEVTGGAVTHVGIALTFGLVVMAMIYAVGHVSGAHLNPAVTLGLVAARKFSPSMVPGYVGSQCLGALLASTTLRTLFPQSAALGATTPAGSDLQSLVLEAILTLMLMVVILAMSDAGPQRGNFAGIAIGGVIGLEALFAGPISGASMNPARSLAPAVVSMRLADLWIYLVGPVAGALVGVLVYRSIRPPSGRRSAEVEECA